MVGDAAAAGGVEDVALVADTGKAPTGVGAVPVVAKATLLALIHIDAGAVLPPEALGTGPLLPPGWTGAP